MKKLLILLLATATLYAGTAISLAYERTEALVKSEKYSGEIKDSREKGVHKFVNSASGEYEIVDGVESLNKYEISTYYERRFDKYGAYTNFRYLEDQTRDIDSEYRAGVGGILYWWESGDHFWKSRLGLQHRGVNRDTEAVIVIGNWLKWESKDYLAEQKVDYEITQDEYELSSTSRLGVKKDNITFGVEHKWVRYFERDDETRVKTFIKYTF